MHKQIRILLPALSLLVSACQSSIPFYTKEAQEPEWYQVKAADADAQGYPSARAVPQRPQDLMPLDQREAKAKELERIGAQVREDPRAKLENGEAQDPEAFAQQAREETIVPPIIERDDQ